MAKILIIDDDERICEALGFAVSRLGHQVFSSLTLDHGLKTIEAENIDVVLLDVRMPDGNGLGVLPNIRKSRHSPEVIIITGVGDPNGAELAIKSGAWDYIEKPPSMHDMTLHIKRALLYREEKLKRKSIPLALKREGIVGSSPGIMECLDLVAQASVSKANVLITGETGSGKEIFARTIHRNSSRRQGNFVVVDCASIPETLVESILFGHEKGAFTGAEKATEGMFKQADGGTLFLDEVGELPLSVQKKLLRSLQEHRFRPLGGDREVKSNFRLLTATNRDLDQLVREGLFRGELLFRLRSITIDLPPLRERKGDIKELALYYVAKHCRRYGMEIKGLAAEFIDTLACYTWPGNVRELSNCLEAILTTTARNDSILFPYHLPCPIRIEVVQTTLKNGSSAEAGPFEELMSSAQPPELRGFIEDMKRKYLENLTSRLGGNVEEICRVSGLSRSSLYAHLKKYKIPIR